MLGQPFLARDDDEVTLVAAPITRAVGDLARRDYCRWAALDELGDSPLYALVASAMVQRFAHALVWLMHKRLAVAMKAEFDNEKDPSKRAWLDAQIALGAVTGRDEQRLWDIQMYTDDITFEVVGCERFVTVFRLWHDLIREVNIRMASALKRHGGAAAVWLGINHLATLGFATIPNQHPHLATRDAHTTTTNATDRPECLSLIHI